jgi:hypothetical protein
LQPVRAVAADHPAWSWFNGWFNFRGRVGGLD